MDITDRIYLIFREKQYRGHVPEEIGELKISKQDTLISLKYRSDDFHGPKFFAYAEGYFDLVDLNETNPAQIDIDPNIRFFSKNLKVLRQTAEFYKSDEDGIRRVIPAGMLPETIEVKITIDRYKNTIEISLICPDGTRYERTRDLKKVTLFN